MKLTNTTTWSDDFLRAMTLWVCEELDLPKRQVKIVHFGTPRHGTHSGLARPWIGYAAIRVHENLINLPLRYTRFGRTLTWQDRLDILVTMTAHELCHIRQYNDGDKNTRERECDKWMGMVLDRFNVDREALLKQWYAYKRPVRAKRPQLSVPERREANAQQKLAEWEAKKRRATNAIKKYRAKVKYYERKHAQAALKGEPNGHASNTG